MKICYLFVIFALLCACSKKTPEKTVAESLATPKPFIANSSGTISPLQMKCWLEASLALDSLAIRQASLSSAKHTLVGSEQAQIYVNTQEILCINAGLSGGLKEYQWILKNVHTAVNMPMLDSFKTINKINNN